MERARVRADEDAELWTAGLRLRGAGVEAISSLSLREKNGVLHFYNFKINFLN